MIIVTRQGTKNNCVGVGSVASEPKYYETEGKIPITNFAINVESWMAKDERGKLYQRHKAYGAVAFGDLAKFCRYLDIGDNVIFMGSREIDDYATKRDSRLEDKYKLVLQACIIQPSVPDESPDGIFKND